MCRRRCWHPVVLLPDVRPPDDTCGCFSHNSEFWCCFLFIVLFSPHNEIFIVLADIWRECSNLRTALLNEKSWVKEVNRSKLKGQEFVLQACRVPRPPPERERATSWQHISLNIKKSRQIHPRQLIKPLFTPAKTNRYNLLNIVSQPLYQISSLLFSHYSKVSYLQAKEKTPAMVQFVKTLQGFCLIVRFIYRCKSLYHWWFQVGGGSNAWNAKVFPW